MCFVVCVKVRHLNTVFYNIKFLLYLPCNNDEVTFLKGLGFQVPGQQVIVSCADAVKEFKKINLFQIESTMGLNSF